MHPVEEVANASPDLPTYHVLALSGGGYRGLYTATILRQLEETLGRPLAKHFDLICGTSAGGLLALGLAAEIPAAELQSMFEIQGARIFGARDWWRRRIGFLFKAKHSNAGLRAVLTEKFDSQLIGNLRHRVLIPAVNYTTGKGQFFKTPHHPSFERDHRLSLVDVALATAAAPAYFPVVRVDGVGAFVDGGLVGNAPGFFGLHEVRHFLAGNQPAIIRVLAIGTMTIGATMKGSAKLDRGLFQWGSNLFDLVISAQESSVDYMLRQTLGQNYVSLDERPTPDQSEDVKALDQVTEAATNTLKDRAAHTFQRALGDPHFQPFRRHLAQPATFFHGPNRNA
jgi:predicted acylesterase/phospholipase RssA